MVSNRLSTPACFVHRCQGRGPKHNYMIVIREGFVVSKGLQTMVKISGDIFFLTLERDDQNRFQKKKSLSSDHKKHLDHPLNDSIHQVTSSSIICAFSLVLI